MVCFEDFQAYNSADLTGTLTYRSITPFGHFRNFENLGLLSMQIDLFTVYDAILAGGAGGGGGGKKQGKK